MVHGELVQVCIMNKTKFKNKFSIAADPMRTVNSAINDFESKEHEPMIARYLLKNFECKPTVLIDVLFYNKSEKVSKELLKKLNAFTEEKFDFRIVWKISQTAFTLEGKIPYPSCKTYEGVCFCKESYWGKTKQNVITC